MKQLALLLIISALCASICSAERQVYLVDKNMEIIYERSQIRHQNKRDIVAQCIFEDRMHELGWNTLSIQTNGKYSDDDQFYAAGKCEGAITYTQIHAAFRNFLSGVLNGTESLDDQTQNFITNQLNWMEESSKENPEDNFWQLVGGMVRQLKGSYAGYQWATENHTELQLDFDHFYYLANMPDLEDVQPCFESQNKTTKSCTIFVKYLGDRLISGHSTMNTYTQMLRIAKTYRFSLHNPSVRAKVMTFSSRPGDFISKDDFFITDTGLNVMETSLLNFNMSNYGFIHEHSLPCWVRLNIANRFAANPEQWAELFERFRSGTHNSQWIVIDYHKFKQNDTNGFAYMVEEAFYYYFVTDVSETLMHETYLTSYNRPNSSFLEQILQYETTNLTYSIHNDARRYLIPKYQGYVDSTEKVKWLLRLNENGDTYDKCNAIGARCDLIEPNQVDGSVKDCFGTMDGKVIDDRLNDEHVMWLINGPAFDYSKNIPPFEWSQCPWLGHEGMPERFEFPWIQWHYGAPRHQRHEITSLDDLNE